MPQGNRAYAGCVMVRVSLAAIALLLLSATSHSQAVRSVPRSGSGDPPPIGYSKILNLWPGEAPMAKGNMPDDTPKLYYYPPTTIGVRSAVIIMPGGGYMHEVMEKEGGAEARWLASQGVTAFVLKYQHAPEYHKPNPMLDGARAVRY